MTIDLTIRIKLDPPGDPIELGSKREREQLDGAESAMIELLEAAQKHPDYATTLAAWMGLLPPVQCQARRITIEELEEA